MPIGIGKMRLDVVSMTRIIQKTENIPTEEMNTDSKKSNIYDHVKKEESENIQQANINNTDVCKDVNRFLREIRTLKRQNRINEQQHLVTKLREIHGSYRSLSSKSGIPLKTVHQWCSSPKERQHKAKSMAQLRKDEFINFLMQDTVTYTSACKRYAGKRFLVDTYQEIYQKYLNQPEYHKYGVISKTTMRTYKPKNILLSGSTPLNQCLCDHCENCSLMIKGLVAAGVRGIPPNKYLVIDSTLCDLRTGQFGTSYSFATHECLTRNCEDCGKHKLKIHIDELNSDLLKLNKPITYHRWKSVEGKSAPQKFAIKKPLKAVVNDFLDLVQKLSKHLFRSNWHKNVFDYIKKNLLTGYVLQVMDFAMNFNNWYQDEVQSAYWCSTQTTIHGTINFFRCPRRGCTQLVTMALVHISDDVKHDSFLARAAQNLTFAYLVEAGVPLDLIIQFCDNCASQYKSRRPFAELARCALQIIRIYFGEKHGKSHADALFGRLKAWMSYRIKSRRFVVTNANDFYQYCREYYQTPVLHNCCQHYRVEFQFIRPSDVRRHQDCDLETHVDKTQEIYSVRNTPEPLTLKVRHVPCLCPPCINEEGQCLNSSHTDPWRLVNLIPQKGANLRKYQKRKRPDDRIRNAAPETPSDEEIVQDVAAEQEVEVNVNDQHEESGDEELPDISFEKFQNRRRRNDERHVTDPVTDKNSPSTCTWMNSSETTASDEVIIIPSSSEGIQESTSQEDEIIEICAKTSQEFRLSGENVMTKTTERSVPDVTDPELPDIVYWLSILTSLLDCTDYPTLEKVATEYYNSGLRALQKREESSFTPGIDVMDNVAQNDIPPDGPVNLKAITTIGDGNCLCRALSKAFYNSDSKHIELRVRIIIEGIINKKKYITDECLERGASVVHGNADLPTVFATFSEYYTPGQKISDETLDYIYSMEIYSCCRMSSYMGIWQLAQASSVLGVPVHTIYPIRGECSIRNDFHRIFFPIDYPTSRDDDPVVIMWTGVREGAAPVHFVPLVKSYK